MPEEEPLYASAIYRFHNVEPPSTSDAQFTNISNDVNRFIPQGPSPVCNSTRLGDSTKKALQKIPPDQSPSELKNIIKDPTMLRKVQSMKNAKIIHNKQNTTNNVNLNEIASTSRSTHTQPKNNAKTSTIPKTSDKKQHNSKKSVRFNSEVEQFAVPHPVTPTFPRFHCRNVDTINLILPIISFPICTQNKCKHVVTASNLKSCRKYFMHHLETIHGLTDLKTVYWCKFCQKIIDGKIPRHTCLLKQKYYNINQSKVNLPHKCKFCLHSYKTLQEVIQHIRKRHKRQNDFLRDKNNDAIAQLFGPPSDDADTSFTCESSPERPHSSASSIIEVLYGSQNIKREESIVTDEHSISNTTENINSHSAPTISYRQQ